MPNEDQVRRVSWDLCYRSTCTCPVKPTLEMADVLETGWIVERDSGGKVVFLEHMFVLEQGQMSSMFQ